MGNTFSQILKSNYNDFKSKIAYQWAPIIFQHVNLKNPLRDMLCAINYDGDWNTSNNRINLRRFDLIPVVYYSLAETLTHYYILYCFYHADDLTHENDLEGCLVIVDKDKSLLLGIITIAHFDFYSYVFENRLSEGRENIDGSLYAEKLEIDGSEHPLVTQELNKHGCYAWKGMPRWMFWNRCYSWNCNKCKPWWMFWGRRDSLDCIGIKYIPSNNAIMPDPYKINTFNEIRYGYILIDMLGPDGFWNKRDNIVYPLTFKSWGIFNSSTIGSASAPWVWDDFDDKLDTGTIFFDPVTIASKYFDGDFNNSYIKYMNE